MPLSEENFAENHVSMAKPSIFVKLKGNEDRH